MNRILDEIEDSDWGIPLALWTGLQILLILLKLIYPAIADWQAILIPTWITLIVGVGLPLCIVLGILAMSPFVWVKQKINNN